VNVLAKERSISTTGIAGLMVPGGHPQYKFSEWTPVCHTPMHSVNLTMSLELLDWLMLVTLSLSSERAEEY
jgi:hypothetical protein